MPVAVLKRTPAQVLRALKADARIQDFQGWCRRNSIPEPDPEWRFDLTRRWRFDFAWPVWKIAVENQGAIFVNGRHTRGASLLKEHEKLNRAAVLGWRVLYASPQTLKSREMLATLTALLTP